MQLLCSYSDFDQAVEVGVLGVFRGSSPSAFRVRIEEIHVLPEKRFSQILRL